MDAPHAYTVDAARDAAARGELESWIGDFLASPGSDNAPLAGLLADQGRVWAAPVLVRHDRLHRLAGPPGAPVLETVDDDAWRALEERLVARVLDRLQDRVELVLEDQVRSSMAPVLDHVVTRLATELRDGLQLTVEQVVARAVAQELAHLRTRG